MIPYKGLSEETTSLTPHSSIPEQSNGSGRFCNSRSTTCKFLCTAFAILLILMLIFCNVNFSWEEVVELDTKCLLSLTNIGFLSVALDASLIQERWSHLNISSPKFLKMTRHLAPGYLRIGGTMADRLIFIADSPDVAPLPASSYVDEQMLHTNTTEVCQPNRTISLMDGDVYSFNNETLVNNITNFTMTGNDWITLNNFATKAGLKILFDLNVLLRDGDNWNSSNALDLIKFSDDHGFDVDWQLGNEPNSFHHVFGINITGAQLAKDFIALKKILNTFPRYATALILGPDVTRPKLPNDSAIPYLKDFLRNVNNSISGVSWHQYYLNGHTAHLKDITAEVLNVLYEQIEKVRDVVVEVYNKTTPPPIWLSETGSAYGGGAWGISDSFVAGFLWLDKLGVAAREGISVVVRQSLYHGYYSLLDEQTLNPLPDWWLSVLYKRLVGPKVIKATKLLGSVRIYCHCTPSKAAKSSNGTVTLFGINMLNNHAIVKLKGLPKRSGDVFFDEYVLVGEDGLASKSVLLNGVRLELRPDGSLPRFNPTISKSTELMLPPLSIGFFVLHGVIIPACSEIAYFA